jgi:hypothetical protein
MSAKTSIVLKLSNGWIILDHVTYVETTAKKVHLVGGEVIELSEDDFLGSRTWAEYDEYIASLSRPCFADATGLNFASRILYTY